MPPIDITAALGAKVKLGNGASPEVFTELQGVHDGPEGPSIKQLMIETRHHGSSAVFRKSTGVDYGQVTFSILYDGTDTQHAALVTAAQARTRKNFQMELTDKGAEKFTFPAYIDLQRAAPVEGFNVYRVTLQIDGACTIET